MLSVRPSSRLRWSRFPTRWTHHPSKPIAQGFCAPSEVARVVPVWLQPQQGQSEERELDLPRRRRVPPLALDKRLLLYTSSEDIGDMVSSAQTSCRLGAVSAAAGFGLIVVNAFATLPPAAFVILLSGAAANSYALAVVAQRLVRTLALRHVEQLTVLPTPPSEAPQKDDEQSSLLYLAATMEERLAATPQIPLEIRTAAATRWLVLREREVDGDQDPADRQASFADICKRLRLLQVDIEDGTSPDQALLAAIVGSPKVISEESAEARTDAPAGLGTPQGDAPRGPMLSEVLESDVQQAVGSGVAEVPTVAIERIGSRARTAGLSILGAGVLFAVGESAKDPDGVPRWKNLKLPI